MCTIFERAATMRDRIKAVEKTVERQAAVLPGAEDMDAIGLYQAEKRAGSWHSFFCVMAM